MSSKQRALGAVSAVAALALVGGIAAQFTTSTTSAPQQIGTGTLSLSLDNVAPTVWTDEISNLAAGDSVERFLDVRNSGSLKFSGISLAQTNTLGSLLSAPSDVSITLKGCEVAWNVTTGVCSTGAVDVLGSSSVAAWGSQAKALGTFEDFGAGEVRHLKLVTTLATGATNAVQAKSGTITYTFSGAQRAAGAWGDVSDASTTLAKPTSVSTSAPSATSLTTSFSDPTKGAATYSLTWGEVGNAASAQTQTLPKGATSYTLSNLKQGTSYTLALTSQLGVQKTVTTSTQTTAVLAPSALVVSNLDKTTATLSWTDNTAGQASYDLVLTPATGTAITKSIPAGSSSTNLTGLVAGTSYSVSLKAKVGTVTSNALAGSFVTKVAAVNLNTATWSQTTVANQTFTYGSPGAADASGNTYVLDSGRSLAKYTVSTNKWAYITGVSKFDHTYGATAFGADGKMYAFGGTTSGSNAVESFDPSTNTWTTMAPIPGVARMALSAATGSDGNIYVIGSNNYGNSVANSVLRYTPSNNTWATMASLPQGRANASIVASSTGDLYVMGGYDGNLFTGVTWKYNYTANSWSTVASMGSGHEGGENAQVAATPDGKIYFVGGGNWSSSTDAKKFVKVYNPANNTWSGLASRTINSWQYGVMTSDASGRLYLSGQYATERLG